MMELVNEFIVPEEYEEERLDTVLAAMCEGQSRSYLKTVIKDGYVLLNNKIVKPSAKVKENDHIILKMPEKIIPDITYLSSVSIEIHLSRNRQISEEEHEKALSALKLLKNEIVPERLSFIGRIAAKWIYGLY